MYYVSSYRRVHFSRAVPFHCLFDPSDNTHFSFTTLSFTVSRYASWLSGDIILGTEQEDDNWWRGKSGPLRGIFPLSCVHELDVTTEGPRSRSASLRGRSASLKVSEFNAQRGTGCGRHQYTMIYTAVEGCEPVWPSGKALGW